MENGEGNVKYKKNPKIKHQVQRSEKEQRLMAS